MSNWSQPSTWRLFSETPPMAKRQPQPLSSPPKESLDAMLQSIDADLDLCSQTPTPLKIALKVPDHPFYAKLKSAIAAHIGEIVEEDADLVLGEGGDIELLAPESYTPETKRALWAELKKRAQRR